MKNKKIFRSSFFIFICLLPCCFTYGESRKLTLLDSLRPHEEFCNNNQGKNRYRIQLHYPYYSFYVDSNTREYVENFPNLEMGITPKSTLNFDIYDGEKYTKVICNTLYIFPDIIFKSENLKELFSIEEGSIRDEYWYLYNCIATYWEVYEKGLALDVVVKISGIDIIEEQARVYLELKDDGKYYETENSDSFGKLRKKYSGSDLFHYYFDDPYIKYFAYEGCSLFMMKNTANYLSDEITFYNRTKEGLEFITPYGCGFFDFKTESISLVPKEKYIGKEFCYFAILENYDFKGEKRKKIITDADLNPPDIKIPLEEKHIWSKIK